MARLMSVAYTEHQVRARRKHVTRRLGWRHARVGQEVQLCRKVMGRKPGEPLERIVVVRFTEVWLEPLADLLWPMYGRQEVKLEGFPGMIPAAFIDRFFIQAQGCTLDTVVTRIRWEYLGGSLTATQGASLPGA